jgi:hypothetical protein
MAKDIEQQTPPEQDLLALHHDDLLKLFEELPFRQKAIKVLRGLRAPPDSGDYKYARLQILRLWAPFTAIVVPTLTVIGLLVFSAITPEYERPVDVMIVEPEALDKLDDIKEIEEVEPLQPDEVMPDMPVDVTAPTDVTAPPAVATAFSPQPATFDSVAMVKSPVILRGIIGSRSPGSRGSALSAYGGGAATEAAVNLALRWLKKYQEPDGKWLAQSGGGPGYDNGVPPALTGLALLTFLAHGETPASEEFGATVEKAIKWLVNNQNPDGHFKQSDGNEYSLPIAAYALCEAYALTKIPMLKEVATRSIEVIIKGQNPGLMWNYRFDPTRCSKEGKERNDISFSGWCIQALKAASLAGLENPGLKDAMKKAVEGVKLHASPAPEGGIVFSYSRGGYDSYASMLTGVGVLSMQLLGYGKDEKTRQALQFLQSATCDWDKPWGSNPIYNWYYTTQAKFHAGGGTWSSWNKQFSSALVKNQTIIKKAIKDPQGNDVDIGYWKPACPGDKEGKNKEHCLSYVYNTTLCALTLQVYYRYLPTYKPPEDAELEVTFEDKEQDVNIEIR